MLTPTFIAVVSSPVVAPSGFGDRTSWRKSVIDRQIRRRCGHLHGRQSGNVRIYVEAALVEWSWRGARGNARTAESKSSCRLRTVASLLERGTFSAGADQSLPPKASNLGD